LKEATLLGFESGIEATKLDTEFQIGESVWYTSNRKVKPGIVTSYQICGVESADHREVYKRVKYTVVPSILRTATQHTEFFVSKLGGSDIFHTKEEALDYVTKYSYPDNPTSNP
jgi:hypothetical protein